MNKTVPPNGGAPAEEVLASASMFLRDSFEELSKLYRAARDGAPPSEKTLNEASAQFKKWAQHALDEKRKVDEFYGKIAPKGGGAEIDFDEARAQIGRRLACLRAAQGSGGVSE